MKVNAPPCRATVLLQPDGLYSVRFDLVNATDQPVTLRTYQPFLQFHMRAEVRGATIAVQQPPFDLPVQPMVLTIPAAGGLAINPPLRLRIGAAAPPSRHRFTWTIAHEPQGLALVFALDLPPPYDLPCRAAPEL